MKQASPLLLRSLFFAALLFCGVSSAAAQSPEVVKVDPPSWWVGSSLNPIRVLIRGRNLRGARVQPIGLGFQVIGAPKVNDKGSYMFLDVAIAPNTRPGERTLKISNASGNTAARFEI